MLVLLALSSPPPRRPTACPRARATATAAPAANARGRLHQPAGRRVLCGRAARRRADADEGRPDRIGRPLPLARASKLVWHTKGDQGFLAHDDADETMIASDCTAGD